MEPRQYPSTGKGADRKEESSAIGEKRKKGLKIQRQYLQLPKGQRSEIPRERKKAEMPWGRL